MRSMSFAKGEMIYREGGIADVVYVVQVGEVEVLRDAGEVTLRLGVLGGGQMVGEAGVVLEEPRSTSVRALTDVVVVALDAEEFMAPLRSNGGAPLRLVQTLSRRLAAAGALLVERELGLGAAQGGAASTIRLLPSSSLVANQIGERGLRVERLPFVVGRRRLADQPPARVGGGVMLRAPNSLDLSPQHFALVDDGDGLAVRDMDSQLGTMVNGIRIASFEDRSSAPLHYGANDIVAGSSDSPFRFSLIVERSARDSYPRPA